MKNVTLMGWLIMLGIAGMSCQKEEVVSPAPENHVLLGKWRYLSNSGGLAGGGYPYYPDKTVIIEFKPDGYFIEYHDNQVKKRYPFFIRADSLSKRETIDYGKYGFRQEYIFRGETLLLMDECNDCYPWAYQRVNQ